MTRRLLFATVALVVTALPASAAGITGRYLEARTTDVYTGPCFANSDMNLTGKHAVMAWQVHEGSLGGVQLDGLGVVAVVSASDTLGLQQTGPARALLIVDARANEAQRAALVRLARQEGGALLRNVLAVESATIEMNVDGCKCGGCASLRAGAARVETRCIDHRHDKICGNETAFYPPLAQDVQANPAVATEHTFNGKGFRETWSDAGRRGAYVGSFTVR